MKRLIILLSIFWVSVSLAQSNTLLPDKTIKDTAAKTNQHTRYSSTLIPAQGKTWGYDIYQGLRLLIHQPSVPGLPGNSGFKIKSDAKKIARLVIKKIKKGEMPPAITIEELRKLKVLEN